MEKYIEKQIEQKEFIEKLHERAKKIMSENIIPMDDFVNLYGKENVEKDKNIVEKLKIKFQENAPDEKKEAKILADILEAIILEESELSNWFGENTSTIKTSDYDDYVNHVDAVVKFEGDKIPVHTALGIDMTYSTNIKEKFDYIKKEIENGILAEVKYFSSSFIKGIHMQIPRLIIGADVKTIKELGELWLDKESKIEGRKKEVKEALGKHSIQFQFLKQMILEAEFFEKYAEKIGKPEITEIYARLKKLILSVYNNKVSKQKDAGVYDKIFNVIKENLK